MGVLCFAIDVGVGLSICTDIGACIGVDIAKAPVPVLLLLGFMRGMVMSCSWDSTLDSWSIDGGGGGGDGDLTVFLVSIPDSLVT